MAKERSASKIKLNSFDDLFGMNDNTDDYAEIKEVDLTQLYEFNNHPFKVNKEKIDELVESIKEYGVLVPGIVRIRPQGGYEIIAGHSRKIACEIAGLKTMPVFIKNLSDDEATIVMVDSNIQRENITISEKAKALKMKYEALKHQGKGNRLEIMQENENENKKTIQRYICLADLNDELLEMVNDKKIGTITGVNLSYLNEEEQIWLINVIKRLKSYPSLKISEQIKEKSRNNELTEGKLWELLSPEIKYTPRKIVFKSDKLIEFFPEEYTETEIEDIIINLLREWKSEKENKNGDKEQ